MADNLPLVPEKEPLCVDVRSVLQEVFRETDYIPPFDGLSPQAGPNNSASLKTNRWIKLVSLESAKLNNHEEKLQKEFAKRLAKDSVPNIYKLHSISASEKQRKWKEDLGLLERKDLKPNLQQDAAREQSLWIQNILNESSGNISTIMATGSKIKAQASLPLADQISVQSISWGEIPPMLPAHTSLSSLNAPLPGYIICIPPQLQFINFKIGQLYTQSLRLLNVSKFELRLSIRPPTRRELDLQLCSRLVITSGSEAKLKIHFRPNDVRVLCDKLIVRISSGQILCVPIECYMQPPTLDIIVPTATTSLSSPETSITVQDVIDLGARLFGDLHFSPLVLRCGEQHASFFLLSEDAWLEYSVEITIDLIDKISIYGAVAGCFFISPVRWSGGGTVRGLARCRANNPGLHTAVFRILCSTAIVRPLHLVADALLFSTKHITLQAQDKDYDICSEDDPSCEYYVNLGTTFSKCSLSATVTIVNHSPISYNYYWSVRPWGVCSCWKQSDGSQESEDHNNDLCPGALQAKRETTLQENNELPGDDATLAVRIEQSQGCFSPRHDVAMSICVPDVGERLGLRRAVLIYGESTLLKSPAREWYKAFKSGRDMMESLSGSDRPSTSSTQVIIAKRKPILTENRHSSLKEIAAKLLVSHGVNLQDLLIVTDIPKDSFPPDIDPKIIKVNIVEEEAIPGISPRLSREVCEVVCAEMEVWWEVVPIRFVLDPPLLLLPYSRRVKSVSVTLRATQLYGVTSVKALWEMTTPAPAPPQLVPGHSSFTTAILPLKESTNDFPETSYIRLISEKEEWSVSSALQCWSSKRALALRQACIWLGVLPPGSPITTALTVFNDTHQHVYWCGTCYRWYRERPVAKACVSRPPCTICWSRPCTCSLLTPYRGSLDCMQQISIQYQANAPDTDGCVATLVQVRRIATDACRSRSLCGSQDRASLVAYRILAPRITLAVLPCRGDKSKKCEGCVLDNGAGFSGIVTSIVRPHATLVVGDSERRLLRITNVTPIPSRVKWEQAIEGEDDLKVTFIPNEFELGSYSHFTVTVILEARRVTSRRLFVRRASVAHAYKPLYLLIDVSISGVEVIAELPIGGDKSTVSSVSIKMMQKDLPWTMSTKPLCPAEMFAEEDRKRTLQKVNICNCRYEMLYIPPKKEPRPPLVNSADYHPVEIVEEPPPLTSACPCANQLKPVLPEYTEPYCLQFTNIPLRMVRSRTINLRNVSGLDARWRSAVRRYPREHARTEGRDQWSGDVRAPGVVLGCSPPRGTVRALSVAEITVSVYADCWGLYYDQILIQMEDMEPLVMDVWMEVVGDPLCFALQHQWSVLPVLWMSHSDPDRIIRVTNTSRADLTVITYILKDNEYPQEELPFRLYMRLFDIPPRVCPCLTAFDSKTIIEEDSHGSNFCPEEMDTGVELFLAPDYGIQDEAFYQVEPSKFSIKSQKTNSLKVRLLPCRELVPGFSILLKCLPVIKYGDTWYRPPPALQRVSLREAGRRPCLLTSCSEIRVALCALDMPIDDVMRVRKRFNLRNVGEGLLETTAVTELPWCLDVSRNACSAHCTEIKRTYSDRKIICLPPRSSMEMIVVLTLKTNEILPKPGESYLPRSITSTELCFYDPEEVTLLLMPLILDLDIPVLITQPELIDFGFISDGNTRKCYFSVKHSSSSAVIELVTSWSGDENFRIWPSSFSLRPRVSECVYVQYMARWTRGEVSTGTVHVRSLCERRAWCGASVRVRACVSRTRHDSDADHTNDSY